MQRVCWGHLQVYLTLSVAMQNAYASSDNVKIIWFHVMEVSHIHSRCMWHVWACFILGSGGMCSLNQESRLVPLAVSDNDNRSERLISCQLSCASWVQVGICVCPFALRACNIRAPNVLSFKGVPSPPFWCFRRYFHPLFINLEGITLCSELTALHKPWVKTQNLILNVVFGFWL